MIRVTEYTQQPYSGDIPSAPARAITGLSSGSSAASSTLSFQTNTNLVVLQADINSWYLIGSSTIVVAASSLMQFIPAGGREVLRVPTGSRLIGFST